MIDRRPFILVCVSMLLSGCSSLESEYVTVCVSEYPYEEQATLASRVPEGWGFTEGAASDAAAQRAGIPLEGNLPYVLELEFPGSDENRDRARTLIDQALEDLANGGYVVDCRTS